MGPGQVTQVWLLCLRQDRSPVEVWCIQLCPAREVFRFALDKDWTRSGRPSGTIISAAAFVEIGGTTKQGGNWATAGSAYEPAVALSPGPRRSSSQVNKLIGYHEFVDPVLQSSERAHWVNGPLRRQVPSPRGSVVPESMNSNKGRRQSDLFNLGDAQNGRSPDALKPIPGLRFREQMSGLVSAVAPSEVDFGGAAAYGQATGGAIETDMTIDYPDLPALLAVPSIAANITGCLRCSLLSSQPLEITWGEFVLVIPDKSHVETDNMRYRLHARAVDGSRYVFEGHKIIRNSPIFDAWRQTTTMLVTISELDAKDLECFTYRGILRISLLSLRRMVASINVSHAPSRAARFRLRRQFLIDFMRGLWPFYSGMLDEHARFTSTVSSEPQLPEPGGAVADVVRWCDPDGVWHDEPTPSACSRLIRFHGGDKGPVILAAGFAMSATSFALDTDEPSLVQLLLERGFDVWLFDYRAGIDLPSAWSQCTIDEIAQVDWPRAVTEVIRIADCRDVQAIGHCVGSVSLLMTLLEGTSGIRSAICAQFTAFPMTSPLNRAKAELRIGGLLADLGVTRMGPDVDGRPSDIALDVALRAVPMPHGERCGLAVCRWINAIFGLTHVHDQLDDATHQRIAQLFGVANLTALRHLVLMLQRGRIVDSSGLDRYLPNVDRLNLPIHFLAGTRNYIFHPQGTEKTLAWLQDSFGREQAERFTVNYIDGYGHLDAIIGRNSAVDVFPDIVRHLEAHPPMDARRLARSAN